MTLAVVAFPVLAGADRQWIESFRARHDPQAARISVHFTLVFPVETLASELAAEIAALAGPKRSTLSSDTFMDGSPRWSCWMWEREKYDRSGRSTLASP